MTALFTPIDLPGALPARLPSPFAPAPHPLARRAGNALMAELAAGRHGPQGERGKMFGVLVAADAAGRVGYLRAFSGLLAGRWQAPGFVGPLFDERARGASWPTVEAELAAFDERLAGLTAEVRATKAALALIDGDARAARATREAADAARRNERARARAGLVDVQALAALAAESRADTTRARSERAELRKRRAPLAAMLGDLEAARAAEKRRQAARSSELLEVIFAGYDVPDACGVRRPIRALFAPASPPVGAGDCAAPKLFAHAFAAGLRPIGLAEFWWGPPPAAGGRSSGVFYPACRGKCGPVLAHMLAGLAVDPAPRFGADPAPAHEPVTVFEDRWIVVVAKPAGLLSVPGRSQQLADSVLTRLRARHPEAQGPIVVHRLDLDTSGLLLAAKDEATHLALAQQFWRGSIAKRYIAWLQGDVPGAGGRITLPLRVDLDDRPRQIHDPVHGKPALTEWRVDARAGGRTRVVFTPRTGRTHQLRVHAAHPLGLGAPIVGDRLYGAPDRRLMLHAEALAFDHPHTAARIELERPAPF